MQITSDMMKDAVHNCALKWLGWMFEDEKTQIEQINGEIPFRLFFHELRDLGLFPQGEKLPDYEMQALFPNSEDWHTASKFAEIINSISDYKLLAFTIYYKMKTLKTKVISPQYRDFFIVSLERLICLTEK